MTDPVIVEHAALSVAGAIDEIYATLADQMEMWADKLDPPQAATIADLAHMRRELRETACKLRQANKRRQGTR